MISKTATGEACTTDLPASALQRLDGRGKVTIAQLSLARATVSANILDIALTVVTDLTGRAFAALNRGGLYDLTLIPGALSPLSPDGTRASSGSWPPPIWPPAPSLRLGRR